MPVNYARLLADGVGAWLQYEQACGHVELFSERYLSHAIGNILSGQSGNRARAEFEHPVIGPMTSGRGRRPAIDFVVCEPYPTVTIAVESKWVGTTTPSIEEILWDLIRLELLVHQSNARAFFLLAGKRRFLEAFFAQPSLFDASTDSTRKPLLRHDIGGIHTVTIGPLNRVRTPFLSDFFEKYRELPFPNRIRMSRSLPFLPDQTTDRYQVYVWQIVPIEGRQTSLGSKLSTVFPRKKATREEVASLLALRAPSSPPLPPATSPRGSTKRL
jgi:hypothetical protein